MGFIKQTIKTEDMGVILQKWYTQFSKKKSDSKTKNAASIASQMIKALTEKNGYLYMAKDDINGNPQALLIANDCKNGLIIRFVLSNVLCPEAKGSGKFLVQEMVSFAEKRDLAIRTTSQNADAFWKNCPGFKLDKNNPTDFIFIPGKNKEDLSKNTQSESRFFNSNNQNKLYGKNKNEKGMQFNL